MKLVLAEKPSVAQSIAKVLGATKREDGYLEGNGYVVSWCVGHLVELAQPEVYDAKYSKWAYEVVYHGSISMSKDVNRQLEDLYVKFNIDHPNDFRGHSMSVSDIVALKVAGEVSFHYVDSVGFQKLENFMKSENYLKNAEMAMEDDYGMIDGIINNGKASGLEERPSVLEQLKEKPVPDVSHKPPKSHPEREIE